ncbi:MAG: acetyltransferase [Kordia sp.]|nr:MAG: acetyltransferase [Kordia sp.]
MCLFGASGHGKVVLDLVESTKKRVVTFLDDNPLQKSINNVSVFHSEKIGDYLDKQFVISVGDNLIRKKISELLKVTYAESIIHSTAVISNTVSMKTGTVVMPMVVVNADTKIGRHVIINTGAVIEHDCLIEDYVHVSPKTAIAGNVIIGEGTHVGIGANVIPNIKIGKWCVIGAGSTIIEDIPDYAVVVGVPGKVIKFNKPE